MVKLKQKHSIRWWKSKLREVKYTPWGESNLAGDLETLSGSWDC